MPVCRPQKRGTEPQLSGRRLKLMDGWGWNRIGIAMAGKSTGLKKDSEQESATETGEACTHTTLIKSGEILRLKLWSGSCVAPGAQTRKRLERAAPLQEMVGGRGEVGHGRCVVDTQAKSRCSGAGSANDEMDA
ncbi:hypothetical protein CVT26_005368 [Gymnopilus dilepis]|uniref:Uncharacterized protein n=1 Tax=Gymnopilus dilepis TaxID=231916 RepID=A0A409YSZ3_9AGAR|nr:hypothetical protein CVT26_005368 [Gymnopilus dilepis]